jgi:hypothetical protein
MSEVNKITVFIVFMNFIICFKFKACLDFNVPFNFQPCINFYVSSGQKSKSASLQQCNNLIIRLGVLG